MAKMIETISFRKVSNTFQDKLKRDVERVKKSKDVLVQADKTRNMYAVSKDQYSKLLHDNVTKHYKHAPERAYDEINTEARQLTASIGIADRVMTTAKKEAYITLKDHKENFANKLPCRLINPAKTEIGRISKNILDRIILAAREKTQVNAWKNTDAVIR